MRQETQPMGDLRIRIEIVDDGVGQTGLTVEAELRRTNGQWLQSGGGWGGSPSTLTLSESSATDQPGLYIYVPAPADLSPTDGQYVAKIEEATFGVLEYVAIVPTLSAEDARKLWAATVCMRFIPSAWNSETGQPEAGTIYYYATEALYDADTVPDGTGSFASDEIEATFSSGQLQEYGRSPT